MGNRIIRTRYAPSPTGLFHIGGARTALFNYLFAKKNNGDFVVRIEDTDVVRNVDGGIDSQLLNLKWLKIFPDESLLNPGNYGPYIQTEKLERYKSLAEKLLSEEKVYRCFCSPEKLESYREKAKKQGIAPKYPRTCLKLSGDEINSLITKNTPFSLRLKINENKEYSWNDIVRGKISVPGSALTDPVILKSNGIPTYNFAVVVDDYDMKISHVIRGEEHISNTPYQLAINENLEINEDILYGHLSVIVDETGKKLSKRNVELKQFIEDYKNMGFTPESITNFMYLLGISADGNKEIFSLSEAVKNFDISKIGKSPSTFDFKKMEWISSEHFKLMSDTAFLVFVSPFITIDFGELVKHKNDCILLFKNQISYAKELNSLIRETFFSNKKLDVLAKENPDFANKETVKFINEFIKSIKSINEWNINSINQEINELKNTTNRSGKNLFMPIRIFSTHITHGPELAKILWILGQDKVVKNCNELILFLSKEKK
ncbi:MAG: glutamate--tRNA ligase [Malacoplasma sp.]|nr:glutamate--tRNA ligase [Malacoplasma sp.]